MSDNFLFTSNGVLTVYTYNNTGSFIDANSICVANSVYNYNVAITANSIVIQNTTTSFSLVSPSSTQATNGGYYLNANGQWAFIPTGSIGTNVNAQYVWSNTQTFSNTITFNQTILGTANNSLYLGGIVAASYVNSSQLSSNLANYQTTAGLAANVLTLTANNTTYVGTVTAANVVSNAQLSSNLANYQTTAGLSANVAVLTSNNSLYLGGLAAASYVNTSQLSSNIAGFQTTAGLAANVLTLSSNNTTYVNSKTEGNLNVNSALYANSSNYANASYTNTFTVGTASYFVANGNLGINTASPVQKLHVSGAAYITGYTYSDSYASFTDFRIRNNENNKIALVGGVLTVFSDTTVPIVFSPNATEAVRITNTGNVGIGTTTPFNSLVTNGAISLANVPFYETVTTITSNYTITTGYNAFSPGPLAINSGITVTIPSGSTWSIT